MLYQIGTRASRAGLLAEQRPRDLQALATTLHHPENRILHAFNAMLIQVQHMALNGQKQITELVDESWQEEGCRIR